MVKQELEAKWRERFDSFARDGKSVREWCAAHEIPPHQFHYWRRRLKDSDAPKRSGDWLALDVLPFDGRDGIVVRVGHAEIDIRLGFDASLLRAVVRALEPGSC